MTPDIERLYQQFLKGRCSKAEAEWLLDYFQSHPGYADMASLIEQELDKPVSDQEYGPVSGFSPAAQLVQLRKRIGLQSVRTKMLRRLLPYAAASLIIGIVSTWAFLENSSKPESEIVTQKVEDVAPGGNRAVLTLADGSTIDLSENQGGIVVGEKLLYLDGSEVLAKETGGERNGAPDTRYAVLSTPKGGTYQVALPDGTQVWLNAASSLRYPISFAGNERAVEITGEGYFAVAKDSNKPFRVISHGQTIEVLGTEFNVSAYPDNDEVKTTLVEGLVRLSSAEHGGDRFFELIPGQQATKRGADVDIKDVDVSQYIAWKSGMFYFKNTPFKDFMKQIADWYDVEVVYEGRVPNDTFGGEMRRDVSLLTVLDLLKASEIDFKIKENQLIIK